jgi:hypothetical protein
MTQTKTIRRSDHQDAASVDRRHTDRISTSFGLMYSALDEADILIGDGTVMNLSSGGLGIRGSQPVKPGMDLTLFLYLPDGDDPLFLFEASVAWTTGRHFGVRFTQLSLREGKRLYAFLLR